MSRADDDLLPYFIPSLSAVLVAAEDRKGSPLAFDEAIEIRDRSACIMMKVADAKKMDENRGYVDVDPENLWYEWQLLRRQMGRKPDLDPGPSFAQIDSSKPDYQKTILEAHASLARFRQMIPTDGSARPEALIKTKLAEGENEAYMWLANTRVDGDAFVAEVFEVPEFFRKVRIGQEFRVEERDLVDWMVNEDGRLQGGYSLRLHRATLTKEEQEAFDQHIGVSEYA